MSAAGPQSSKHDGHFTEAHFASSFASSGLKNARGLLGQQTQHPANIESVQWLSRLHAVGSGSAGSDAGGAALVSVVASDAGAPAPPSAAGSGDRGDGRCELHAPTEQAKQAATNV
jgi:hypothetical protein